MKHNDSVAIFSLGGPGFEFGLPDLDNEYGLIQIQSSELDNHFDSNLHFGLMSKHGQLKSKISIL